MNAFAQVLSIVSWFCIGLGLTPVGWLLLKPYIRGWSATERRARELLRDVLTPEQLHQLTWRGYVEIRSSCAPERVYRVPRSRGYVQVIEEGRAIMRLCLQPVESLPSADVVVLHALMIEANEEFYLQQANKYLFVD